MRRLACLAAMSVMIIGLVVVVRARRPIPHEGTSTRLRHRSQEKAGR